MIIYPEIKKIAGALRKIERLSALLDEKIGMAGVSYKSCYLVDGCSEDNAHLYKSGCRIDHASLIDGTYYNLFGDSCSGFYGTLYFRTNVPGQFVAVPFVM